VRSSWWKWLATASFVSYFALLHSAVYYEREGLGFFVAEAQSPARVVWVGPGSPAEQAGFALGDHIISMNDLAITNSRGMDLVYTIMPIAAETTWVIERDGVRSTRTMRPVLRYWIIPGAPFVIGSVVLGMSLALGLLLLWRGPPDGRSLHGAWLLMSLGCVFLPMFPNSLAPIWRSLPAPLEALLWPAALSSTFAHLILFVFCARVPKPRLSWPQFAMAALPGAAIVVYIMVSVVFTVYAPPMALALPLPEWLLFAGPLSYPAYFFASALVLMSSARHAADATDRRRARTLLAGIAVGGTGLVIFALALALERSGRLQAVYTVLLTSVVLFCALPATFAYATLRHKLFDLRVIVRLGLQYALARGLILAVIPLAIVALVADAIIHGDQPLQAILASRGWTYTTIAAIAGLVYFKRDDWMAALDRRFFRERYAAQQILKDVVEDIGRSADFDAAAQKVVSRIDSALHPVMTAVMTRPRSATAFSTAAKRPETSPLSSLLSGHAITQVVRALGRPVVFGRQGLIDIPADQKAWLAESNVEVVVPIATDASKDEAVLVLGPRRSEEPYSREDLDLLATIGASLALLIGRSAPDTARTVTSITPAPRLVGRYRIERPIGEGGMGVVFAAVDETLERQVAIKVIKDQHVQGDGLARFHREARTAASLSHPHIVTVHDFGVDDTGSPFLVMELLEGQSLRSTIKADGRMPVARALTILAGLASAVGAAHAKGVIHRDLKPENVFLTSATHAKILDYGIAKAIQSKTTFATPGVLGTLAYMAPEQAGGGDASPAWDVWALSVIAFEMLTGQHPFGGGLPVTRATPARTIVTEIDESLASSLDRALSLAASDRPPTAAALIDSLQK
jgi:hypothetical protein